MDTKSQSKSKGATVQLDGGTSMQLKAGTVIAQAIKVGDSKIGGSRVGESKGDKALNEQLSRRLKVVVFAFSLFFVACLSCLFFRYCIYFMHSMEVLAHAGKPIAFDWHIILLAFIMIVPATAIMLVLARSIFVGAAARDDESSTIPTVTLVKEIAEALKAVAGK